jgi:hypothetical protein
MQRDLDTLTPLDARNSLLLERDQPGNKSSMFSVTSMGHEKDQPRSMSPDRYGAAEEGLIVPRSQPGPNLYRPLTPSGPNDATRSLMHDAAPPGVARQPTVPNVNHSHSNSNDGYVPYGAAYRYPNGY